GWNGVGIGAAAEVAMIAAGGLPEWSALFIAGDRDGGDVGAQQDVAALGRKLRTRTGRQASTGSVEMGSRARRGRSDTGPV
ncbi:hypothetical protein AB4084_35480, partial [Lysobacter sp. 2RAB21]